MSRRKYPVPFEHLHITLPAEDKRRVEVILFSAMEQRVPQGAWQRFVQERIREFLDYSTLDLTQFGFAEGYFVRGPKLMIEQLKEKLDDVFARDSSPN